MRSRRATAVIAFTLSLVATRAHAGEEPAAATPATGSSETTPGATQDAEKPIVVWPTLTPAGDDPNAAALHKPGASEGNVYARAQELDATLRDAVQDLGFALDIGDPGPTMGHARDLDMVDRASRSSARAAEPGARGTWVVSARLEPIGADTYVLRIVAVPPRGKVLRVRVERVSGADVAVRGLVLLRDLLASPGSEGAIAARPQESATTGIMSELRSPGRAVLAANAALFGAYTAYSVQRASGSDDPRLLYPLLTVGTGVGLGAALLVAAEWDVSTGDAWTLAGAAWWGAGSGILLANGLKDPPPLTDRYAWGIGGGLVGLGLATVALARSRADEGDAVLVHSGAALGLSLGALGDFFHHGDLDRTPYTGAGLGSAIGLVSAGTLATFVQVSPSRVMLVDLGVGLGAAAGAAAGSPLVFENVTQDKTRGFVAATFAGALAGGGVAWWLTRDRANAPAKSSRVDLAAPRIVPFGGVVGASATRTGSEPAYGAGVRGTF